MKNRILITDDEDLIRWSMRQALEEAGYEVLEADSGEVALEIIQSKEIHLVLLDIVLPGKDGVTVLEEMRNIDEKIKVIMITAFGSIENAVKCVKYGAYDYLPKPFNLDEVVLKVKRALDSTSLAVELDKFKIIQKSRFLRDKIIYESRIMKEIMDRITKINQANVDVILITGETGTGKGLMARHIHSTGPNSMEPFVNLNCTTIPDNLLESELFGYEKGAFTDAKEKREGVVEQAQGGTLLLDEIGEMPIGLQSKLLQFIEEKKIRKLGSNKEIELNLRLISTTNRDLQEAIQNGQFRRDLYHRLNLIHIHLPTLRERREDIVPLSDFFLKKFSRKYGRNPEGFTEEAYKALMNYDWPGNIRELSNVIERCCILEKAKVIERPQVLDYLVKAPNGKNNSFAFGIDFHMDEFSLEELLINYKRQIIEKALAVCDYNKTEAAKLLKMDRSTFRYQMKILDIK